MQLSLHPAKEKRVIFEGRIRWRGDKKKGEKSKNRFGRKE